MITTIEELNQYLRNQPEQITETDNYHLPMLRETNGEDFETIKTIVEYDRKQLEAQYKKLPYMMPYLSEQQEFENYEKRMEIRERIKTKKGEK